MNFIEVRIQINGADGLITEADLLKKDHGILGGLDSIGTQRGRCRAMGARLAHVARENFAVGGINAGLHDVTLRRQRRQRLAGRFRVDEGKRRGQVRSGDVRERGQVGGHGAAEGDQVVGREHATSQQNGHGASDQHDAVQLQPDGEIVVRAHVSSSPHCRRRGRCAPASEASN